MQIQRKKSRIQTERAVALIGWATLTVRDIKPGQNLAAIKSFTPFDLFSMEKKTWHEEETKIQFVQVIKPERTKTTHTVDTQRRPSVSTSRRFEKKKDTKKSVDIVS